MMIRLQQGGCGNINIVSPTHIVPQLIRSIGIAARRGLSVPIVYNSGGYDAVETLRLLDGIIDIYMPDAKYGSNDIAAALSHASGYVDVMKDALTGRCTGRSGISLSETVLRSEVCLSGTLSSRTILRGAISILPWIAENISRDTYVNIMDQYHPANRVFVSAGSCYPALTRGITAAEYRRAIRIAQDAGLHRGFSG